MQYHKSLYCAENTGKNFLDKQEAALALQSDNSVMITWNVEYLHHLTKIMNNYTDNLINSRNNNIFAGHTIQWFQKHTLNNPVYVEVDTRYA